MEIAIKETYIKQERYDMLAAVIEEILEKIIGKEIYWTYIKRTAPYKVSATTEFQDSNGYPELYVKFTIK